MEQQQRIIRRNENLVNLFIILRRRTYDNMVVTSELMTKVIMWAEFALELSNEALLAASASSGVTNGYVMAAWLYNLLTLERFRPFKSRPDFLPAITAAANHFVNRYFCGLYLANPVDVNMGCVVTFDRLIGIPGVTVTAASMGILLSGVDNEVLGHTYGKRRQLYDAIIRAQ